MEEPYGTNNLEDMRFKIYIVIHIVLCIVVFFFAKILTDSLFKNSGGSSDLDELFFAFTFLFRGIIYIIGSGFGIMVTAGLSAALLIPFRSVAVTKNSRVSEFEVDDTLKVMYAGVILTVIAGIIFSGFGCLVVMGILFVPVLIMEYAIYWTALREGNRSEHSTKVPLESSDRTVQRNRPQMKRKMQTKEKARFLIYIVIHSVLCLAVFLGAKFLLESKDLLSAVVLYPVCNIVLMDGAVVLLTPFRLIGIRQFSQVTDFEVKGTAAVMIAGVVLTTVAGGIYIRWENSWLLLLLFLPIVFLELLLYWSGLVERKHKLEK